MTTRTVLQINASLFSQGGKSSQMSQQFINAWHSNHPLDRIIQRDLATHALPHLDAERFTAFITPADQRSPAQQAIAAASQALIDELEAADVVVLGLPMYNFGIPSQLKAYFDHIARAGISFRYTDNGPEGLLGDKQVYVLAARGGLYQGTAKDSQTHYVVDFFNFIGIHNIQFVYAEGLNMGEQQHATALAAAQEQIAAMAA